ncbi:MAG: 3'-5' exonuclease [Polyangiales bacterium]
MDGWKRRLLVFDTESTGVDVATDRVVELAAVYFVDGKFEDKRQMLVNPERPIPKEATEVHGIGDAEVRGKPAFRDIADRFAMHLDGRALSGEPPLLVGYNAIAYDVPLLNAEFARAGHPARIDASHVVDPMITVRWHLRHLRSRKLGDVCERFGVKLANAHRAWADAQATGELLFALVAEGLVPEEPEAMLEEQERLVPLLEREFEDFSYWLYRDREDGALRLGAGKYCGEPLDDVDTGYLEFLCAKMSDLPERVRQEFERRLG